MFYKALAFLVLTTTLYAQESFVFSEAKMKELSLEVSPQWEAIEASFLMAKSESQQLHDRFKPTLFGEASYGETREQPIIQFIPVWTPTKTAQVGVRQAFRGGVSMSAAVGADQRSAMTPTGTYKNVSTSTVRLDLQIDLWKDLFGRLSKAQSDSATFSQERAEFEKKIQHKAFLVSLRRIYWAMVANNEQIKIAQAILKVSGEQLSDSRKRLQAGVTDSGEVARYEAQAASRQGNILYYEYQKEILIKQLKSLLPNLQGKNITLDHYDMKKVVDQVLVCTKMIASQNNVPMDFTQYDEVTQFLRKTKTEQLKLAQAYDDVDLKFVGMAKTTGVSSNSNGGTVNRGSYGGAFDDWQDNNRTGYSVGLQLAVPIGKGDTRKTQELLAEKKFEAQIAQSDANLSSTHHQLVKSILLLTEVIKTQKQNTAALEKRLSVQNRKFKEARVSVNDLIQDQDALLGSSLSVVNVELEILNTLFDYLVVFTETPCEFNRI
jgi:outer membrane protein TolC